MASAPILINALLPHVGKVLTPERAARVMASVMAADGFLPVPRTPEGGAAAGRWSTTRDISEVLRFFSLRMPLTPAADMEGIGLRRDGELVAGVIYEGWNDHNCWMHVCAEPGARWMTRSYLRECFEFPFVERGLRTVRGHVNASNAAARRLDEHLGFREEARLCGAASDGGDVILYVMRREECRFIGGRANGR